MKASQDGWMRKNEIEEAGFLDGMMQSLSSSGPIINVMALFPLILMIMGRFSILTILVGGLLGLSTVFSTVFFSKRLRTNGGYFTYTGTVIGKRSGVFVSLIYIIYAGLSLPAIASMDSFFLKSVFPEEYVEIIMLVTLFIAVILTMAFGSFRISIRYLVLSSVVEIFFMLYIAVSVLSMGVFHSPSAALQPTSILESLPFCLLALSGIGSSIFISEQTRKWRRNTHLAITTGYIILIALMILLVFALSFYLPTQIMNEYIDLPISLMNYLGGSSGTVLEFIGLALVLNGSLTLGLGYMNALRRAVETATADRVFGKKVSGSNTDRIVIIILMLVSAGVIVVSMSNESTAYEIFELISYTMGMLFITVHSFTNVSLMILLKKIRHVVTQIVPLFSMATFILIIAEGFALGIDFSIYFIILFSSIVIFSVTFVVIRFGNGSYAQYVNFQIESLLEE